MPERSNVVFVIDGSFEGLLSALFFGFSQRIEPVDVVDETHQIDLFHHSMKVPTKEEQAQRVARGLVNQGGLECYQMIYKAFLCEHEIRYLAIYQYACIILREGSVGRFAIATDAGSRVMKLAQFLEHESHLLTGVVRFSVLENGVMFAKIAPKSDCLEIVLDHFVKRFSAQGILLCDTVHEKAGIYQPGGQRMIVPIEKIPNPELGEDERQYRAMWKQFCRSVGISQRYNIKCQNTHIPKRYRLYMTEFFCV